MTGMTTAITRLCGIDKFQTRRWQAPVANPASMVRQLASLSLCLASLSPEVIYNAADARMRVRPTPYTPSV